MSARRRQAKAGRRQRQANVGSSPRGRVAFVQQATDAEVLEAARHGTFAVRIEDALFLHAWTERQRIPLPNLAGAVMLILAAEWGEDRARKILRDFADAVDLPPNPGGLAH